MSVLYIPATAGTYYFPAGTSLAALVTALPAVIGLTDGDWTESTKTLTSNGGTALTAGTLLAGDLVNVTGGTSVLTGTYVVATTTGAGPTSVVLTTSLSSTGGNLTAAHNITANSTLNSVLKEGYLANPARVSNVNITITAPALGIGPVTISKKSLIYVLRVATQGAVAAAGDAFDVCDGAGTVTTPPGISILAGNAARTYVWESIDDGDFYASAAGVTCVKTGGNTSFILSYRDKLR